METYKTILKRRSIRSFRQKEIPLKKLKRMVNAARLAPSAANLQPLEYLVINSKALRPKVFEHLKWAGYVAPRANPKPGCEPVAYILIMINAKKTSSPIRKRDELGIRFSFKADIRDVGAAAENIILTAQSCGIASCWLGAINKLGLKKAFDIPRYMDIDSVIALGYPKTVAKLSEWKKSVKYYMDKQGNFYVPKRPLADIMHLNKASLRK